MKLTQPHPGFEPGLLITTFMTISVIQSTAVVAMVVQEVVVSRDLVEWGHARSIRL